MHAVCRQTHYQASALETQQCNRTLSHTWAQCSKLKRGKSLSRSMLPPSLPSCWARACQNTEYPLKNLPSPCIQGNQNQDTLPSADRLLSSTQGENIKLTSHTEARKPNAIYKKPVHDPNRAAAVSMLVLAAVNGHLGFLLFLKGKTQSPLRGFPRFSHCC